MLAGSDLGSVTSVLFDGVAGTQLTGSGTTSVHVVAPPHAAGTVDVVAVSPGGTSAARVYAYVERPAVIDVTPARGPEAGGGTVTITGSSLEGTTSVTFGGRPASGVTVVSATEIRAVVPSGTGTVDVDVIGPGGPTESGSAGRFQYFSRAVTSLAAHDVSTTSVSLAWSNGGQPEQTGTVIRRATGSAAPPDTASGDPVAVVSGPGSLVTDDGLSPGTTYTYAAFAAYGAVMAPATTLTVTTPARDSITGVVTGPSAPASGVTVEARDATGVVANRATTDTDGRYHLGLLAPGSYHLCAEPTERNLATTTDSGLLASCAAGPVVVTSGATSEAPTMALTLGSALSGRVTTSGSSRAGVVVSVTDPAGRTAAMPVSNGSGSWRATGLAPGNYLVCATTAVTTVPAPTSTSTPTCWSGASGPASATPVSTTPGQSLQGLDVTLEGPSAAAAAATQGTARMSTSAELIEAATSVASTSSPSAPVSFSTDPVTTASCRSVLVLGARGSGQAGPGTPSWTPTADDHRGLGPEVDALARGVAAYVADAGDTAATVSLAYPAEGVPQLVADVLTAGHRYLDGLEDGRAKAYSYLVNRGAVCPKERVVLLGYSQGAMAMHRARFGSLALPTSVRDRVDAVVLVADGDRIANDAVTAVGSARADGHGIAQILPSVANPPSGTVPSSQTPRVISECNGNDLVCDTQIPAACIGAALTPPYPTRDLVLQVCAAKLARDGVAHGTDYQDNTAVQDDIAQKVVSLLRVPLAVVFNGSTGPVTGREYTAHLMKTSGIGAMTYATSSGALPPGLSLSPSTGAITGTPTGGGSYPWTWSVTDGSGKSFTGSVVFTVGDQPGTDGATVIAGELAVYHPDTWIERQYGTFISDPALEQTFQSGAAAFSVFQISPPCAGDPNPADCQARKVMHGTAPPGTPPTVVVGGRTSTSSAMVNLFDRQPALVTMIWCFSGTQICVMASEGQPETEMRTIFADAQWLRP